MLPDYRSIGVRLNLLFFVVAALLVGGGTFLVWWSADNVNHASDSANRRLVARLTQRRTELDAREMDSVSAIVRRAIPRSTPDEGKAVAGHLRELHRR